MGTSTNQAFAQTMTALIIVSIMLLSACGNTKQLDADKKSLKSENEALKADIKKLTAELEDLKQTEQYLYSKAKESFDTYKATNKVAELKATRDLLDKLLTRFPESIYNAQATTLLKEVDAKVAIVETIEKGISEMKSAIAAKDFSRAWSALNSIKKIIPDDLYAKGAEAIDQEQNKPIQVSLRELQAEPLKYDRRRITIGPLKVMGNDMSRAAFDTNPSTGGGFGDYDRDVSIEVFYDKTSNISEWRNLSSDRRPEIYVIGIFNVYRNNISEGYISAEEIRR